jgi:hypothetical protein
MATPRISGPALTEEQITKFTEAFARFDKDRDGTIRVADFTKKDMKLLIMEVNCANPGWVKAGAPVPAWVRPRHAEVDAVINEVNAREHGTIDLAEFLTLMGQKTKDYSHYIIILRSSGSCSSEGCYSYSASIRAHAN